MYCGNCFRDNALVAALRQQGHSAWMIPLYLPIKLDEEDQSRGGTIFFGGINVFLEQVLPLFANAPSWLRKPLSSQKVLQWAGGYAGKTKAKDLGALALSMIKGEEGRQARELEELIVWLRTLGPIDVVCLSNALLAGLARRIKQELKLPVICTLQGEDSFLDSLPDSHRELTWKTLSDRCQEIDLFIAPSHYFANLMGRRLALPADRVAVLYNGINLDGYSVPASSPVPPVLGYFARMCREKGLDTLVDAYILIRQEGLHRNLRLHIGGGCGPSDEPLVAEMRERLQKAGLLGEVQFFPNLTREQKIEFYRSITVLSVPALYGEAFGLYLVEAWAAGVPVVQPRPAAFPELIEVSGAGLLCEPKNPPDLARTIAQLLSDPERLQSMRQFARRAAVERFAVGPMAASFAEIAGKLVQQQIDNRIQQANVRV